MNPRERELLDGVLAEPDEEAPRRVIADYYAERDEPRGELIHLQCEIARVPLREHSRLDPMQAREHQILSVHGKRWLDAVGLSDREVVWDRGFVDVVRTTAERLASVQERLAQREPVRRLSLRSASFTDLERLLAWPWFARLRGLDLDNNPLGPAAADAIVRARPPHLNRLNLRATRLGDTGVVALARSPALAGVVSLDLGCNGLGTQAATALATCKHLTALEQLELERNPIDDAGALALAQSPHLHKLKRLNLTDAGLSAQVRQRLTKRFGEAWVC